MIPSALFALVTLLTPAAAIPLVNNLPVVDIPMAIAAAPARLNFKRIHGVRDVNAARDMHATNATAGKAGTGRHRKGKGRKGLESCPNKNTATAMPTVLDESSAEAPPAETEPAEPAPVESDPVASALESSAPEQVAKPAETPTVSSTEETTSTPPSTVQLAAQAPSTNSAPTWLSNSELILAANPTEADLTGSSEIASYILKANNDWRAQFSSPPVTWWEAGARQAAAHTSTCVWAHQGGDNLAAKFGSSAEMRFSVSGMMEMWAVEWDYYPGFLDAKSEDYSHFTAMTWAATTEIGCAWNVNCGGSGSPSETYFVCRYNELGNMQDGQGTYFHQNIHNFTGWNDDPALIPQPLPAPAE